MKHQQQLYISILVLVLASFITYEYGWLVDIHILLYNSYIIQVRKLYIYLYKPKYSSTFMVAWFPFTFFFRFYLLPHKPQVSISTMYREILLVSHTYLYVPSKYCMRRHQNITQIQLKKVDKYLPTEKSKRKRRRIE